jgi:DNA invertase Pin-like site-specific DNA recombinase
VTSAAIYARVSSARQKKDETIGSQTAALREHAAQARLDVPEEWVFEDEGHSGATLVRPALEALRDLVAQGCVDVVLVYSPDRLARKFAYQALLLEEFARAGVRAEFVRGPRGDSPEDQLLIQFQGIFAEYEKAQLAERYRRGKAYRARTGSVNVLSGAPFGYRYVRKTDLAGAAYEIIGYEAVSLAGAQVWHLGAQLRNLAMNLGQRFGDFRFLLRDRGSNFTRSFDAIFQATGATILRTAVQAPRMNAICERLAGTLRREVLDRILILGQAHLRAVLAEYQQHYNTVRPHQGIGQRIPDIETPRSPRRRTRARDVADPPKPVLNGLINEYQRAA